MNWENDKKEILSKFITIYEGIKESHNRYEAGKVLFAEFDFFASKLLSEDATLTAMLQVDNEFVETYLENMSELIGEEK